MEKELLKLLDDYNSVIVYCDRNHIVKYLNKQARDYYGERVKVGASLANCHNEESMKKIDCFLKRADEGENEMLEAVNPKRNRRTFFVPVRDDNNQVIGYYERHEYHFDF